MFMFLNFMADFIQIFIAFLYSLLCLSYHIILIVFISSFASFYYVPMLSLLISLFLLAFLVSTY